MNVKKIVTQLYQAAMEPDAPQALQDIAVAHAQGAPVDLLAAIVRWAGALDDTAIAALPDACWAAAYRAAEAVAAYRWHGLDDEAATLMARRAAAEAAA